MAPGGSIFRKTEHAHLLSLARVNFFFGLPFPPGLRLIAVLMVPKVIVAAVVAKEGIGSWVSDALS